MRAQSLSKFLLLLSGAAFVGTMVLWYRWRFPPPAPPTDAEKGAAGYDWEASRRNLVRIGQALQLYREVYPPKPVGDRRTRADAGLPPLIGRLNVNVYASETDAWMPPKEVWFVTKSKMYGREATSLTASEGFRLASHYHTVIDAVERMLNDKQMETYWSDRGEQVPVMFDMNMYTSREMKDSGEPVKVLVLRLSGDVDSTYFQWSDYAGFLLSR